MPYALLISSGIMLSEFLTFNSKFLWVMFDCNVGPIEEPFLTDDDGMLLSSYHV